VSDLNDFYTYSPRGPFDVDEEKLVEALKNGTFSTIAGSILSASEAREIATAMIEGAKKAWKPPRTNDDR
jgi:hypothetical protein